MKHQGDIRIGISGWRYVPWRKDFYPEKLAQRRELEYASRQLRSIEINGTFYALQRPSSFEAWHDQTPDDFIFSVKGPRYITHITRLDHPKEPLANFFASGILRLGKKLGPVLWQFPPSFRYDEAKMDDFFSLLPRDTAQASKLARSRGERMKGRAAITSPETLALRHAVEIRHLSFECEAFIQQLRKHQIAIVVADTAGKWPVIEDVTSDFVYVRLHGDEKLYVSGYTDAALDKWEKKIRRWSLGGYPRDAHQLTSNPSVRPDGRDVFVYFDNDVKVKAPFDAMKLADRLK